MVFVFVILFSIFSVVPKELQKGLHIHPGAGETIIYKDEPIVQKTIQILSNFKMKITALQE